MNSFHLPSFSFFTRFSCFCYFLLFLFTDSVLEWVWGPSWACTEISCLSQSLFWFRCVLLCWRTCVPDLSLAGGKATFQLRCRRQEAPGRGPGGFKTWKSSTGLDLPLSGTAAPDVVTKHQSGLSRQETGVVRACASEELFWDHGEPSWSHQGYWGVSGGHGTCTHGQATSVPCWFLAEVIAFLHPGCLRLENSGGEGSPEPKSTVEHLEGTVQQRKKAKWSKGTYTLGLIVQIAWLPSLQKDLTTPCATSRVWGAFGLCLALVRDYGSFKSLPSSHAKKKKKSGITLF